MLRKIPIGISEFRKNREGNYYYVDKTKFIEEIINDGSEVVLFTRPRRFGKTLNMTMLRDFLDITLNTKDLFSGLYIEQSEVFGEINTHPCLYFSFKDCKGSMNMLLQNIKKQLHQEYQKYYFIYDSLNQFLQSDYDTMIKNLRDESPANFERIVDSIRLLTQVVSIYYKQSVMLLIDEYDTPMAEAYSQKYYDDLESFFSTLFGAALKDNPYLGKGVLTGIQRISKENIFSDLNNLTVATVKDALCNCYFGLTPEETEELLNYYGLELSESVTSMYNGYNFGGQQVYNPWSVLNYAKNKHLDNYWIHTSNNRMIKESILQSGETFHLAFEELISQGTVSVPIDLQTAYAQLKSASTLWGLLLNAGYITLADNEFNYLLKKRTVKIPNEEVKSEFKKIVSAYAQFSEMSLENMFESLVFKRDLEQFKITYKKLVKSVTSYHDARENAYHMLFLGMCCYLDNYYEIKSNLEAGDGRSDIILRSRVDNLNHLIIEFKQGTDLISLSKAAVEQIKGKQYYHDLHGSIYLMGVAHDKKNCEILIEEIKR